MISKMVIVFMGLHIREPFLFSAVRPNAVISGGHSMKDVMVIQEGLSSRRSQKMKRKRIRMVKIQSYESNDKGTISEGAHKWICGTRH